ncbi:MAG: cysteine desulfurase [Clostridia bacterium]|nr:cysteine desulfurase [Clostridia bacterium]
MNVYADHAATTPLRPVALAEMTEALRETYGNPSSVHSVGQEAKIALEAARYTVASALGCKTGEITFTASASEANNQALLSAAAISAELGKMHLISTAIEHHSVLHTLDQLKLMGFEVTLVPVGPDGIVDPARIHAAIRENTGVVSVMAANNEVGSIQPVAEIAALCQIANVLFHVDAAQAVGHMDVRVDDWNVDLLTLSAHKFGGPKGAAALYARTGLDLSPMVQGGPQERGKRAGTENVPAIVGMAAALEDALTHQKEENARTLSLREKLIRGLLAIPGVTLNGPRDERTEEEIRTGTLGTRLPGNVNVCFEGVASEPLLVLLNDAGICASAGSACQSGALDPSHVLLALGRSKNEAMSALRLTLGATNTDDEVDYLLEQIRRAVDHLRG